MSKLEGVDWSDAFAIGKLRVGDFACGTGALLSAVYEQAAARHANAGGDPVQLHRVMMEEVLYGCDVMPSAIHITGSTLSGMQPSVGFNQSRLYTMAYGRQGDGSVKIGSLELRRPSEVMTLFNTNDPALRTGSVGEETAAQVNVDIPDAGFDLVIMNPPFTRATNHEGAHADVTNPAFAAFDATEADQTAMGERINQLGRDTCYHGNAGIASAFAALAHRKLKPGGVLVCEEPDLKTIYSEPPSPAYAEGVKRILQLADSLALDFRFGAKLALSALSIGLEVQRADAYQRHFLGGKEKGYWTWSFAEAKPSLLSICSSPAELDKCLSDMREVDRDPRVIVGHARMHQVVARKPS